MSGEKMIQSTGKNLICSRNSEVKTCNSCATQNMAIAQKTLQNVSDKRDLQN